MVWLQILDSTGRSLFQKVRRINFLKKNQWRRCQAASCEVHPDCMNWSGPETAAVRKRMWDTMVASSWRGIDLQSIGSWYGYGAQLCLVSHLFSPIGQALVHLSFHILQTSPCLSRGWLLFEGALECFVCPGNFEHVCSHAMHAS